MKATEMANELVKEILKSEFGEDNYNALSERYPGHMDKIVNKLRDVCILTGKNNTGNISSLFDFSNDEDGLSGAIKLLDNEINAAVSKYRNTFFNQKREDEINPAQQCANNNEIRNNQ